MHVLKMLYVLKYMYAVEYGLVLNRRLETINEYVCRCVQIMWPYIVHFIRRNCIKGKVIAKYVDELPFEQ